MNPVRLFAASENGTTLEPGNEEELPHFSLVVYTGGIAQPKDFPCPVVIDLAGLDIPCQKIPVRYEHKSYQGVGHTEKIWIEGGEVLAEGVISRDTSWARDVAQSAKNGFPWQASMGGPIHETEYVPPGHSVTVNGQSFEGELYVIRKMTLKEISFVDLAADENTSAIIEAQYEEKDTLEMKDRHQTSGVRLQAENIGQQEPLKPEARSLEPYFQKMLIDQRRIAAIEKIGGGKFWWTRRRSRF